MTIRFDRREWMEQLEEMTERLPYHPFARLVEARCLSRYSDGVLFGRLREAIQAYSGSDVEGFYSALPLDPHLLIVSSFLLQRLVHLRSGIPRRLQLPAPLDVGPSEIRIVAGHARVDGHCTNAGVIIVLGDLWVRGSYEDRSEQSLLFVAGDARVPFVSTQGVMAIGSELDVTLYASDSEESRTLVGGAIRCDVLWPHKESVTAEALSVRHGLARGEDPEPLLARFFPAELIDGASAGSRRLKVRDLFERLRRGETPVDLSVD